MLFKMRGKNGFGAFEIIIVVGIMVMLTVLTIISYNSYRRNAVLDASHSLSLSLLNEARSKTLASFENHQYGVHFETNALVLFRGVVYDSASTTNVRHDLDSRVVISEISLGGGSDVIFARQTGKALANGSITLSLQSDPSRTKKISIYPTGVVQ